LKIKNISCTCQECGKQYKIDIIIDDDLWENIKPKDKPVGGGLLCPSCIFNKLEIDYYGFKIKNNMIGKKVDKSKATKYYEMNETAFPKGSRLNPDYKEPEEEDDVRFTVTWGQFILIIIVIVLFILIIAQVLSKILPK